MNVNDVYSDLYLLCQKALGSTAPNPNVAAAIYSPEGKLIADGFHNRLTSPDHAEVVAIKRAKGTTSGSTIVVSLEPCSHTGATPPCTRAIIDAGISRVIYAVQDPNPVASGGAEVLRQAGIQVDYIESPSLAFIQRAWLRTIEQTRPLMIWKVAVTLDGKVAAEDGTSQWITGEASRADVQLLRAQSDAILIGTGTALRDNPTLLPRGHSARPLRIIIGEREILSTHNVFDGQAETIQLQNRNLEELTELLKSKGLNQVLIEAGPQLGSALLSAGLIDEIVMYQAPKVLGSGSNFIADLGISTLAQHIQLELISTEQMGDDVKSHYRIRSNS